jgi:hypothetical protein
MSLTNEQIIEAIGEKTVLEVVELIKAMEESSAFPLLLLLLAQLLLLPLLKSKPNSTSCCRSWREES